MSEDLRVELLREKHQTLDDEIDELNERHHSLSPAERQRVKEMKFKRLRIRDIISEIESGKIETSNDLNLDSLD
jgi:uncharacterized protein YdcH (DUF465 family)|tara:strand:+ start:193 stop:414 length:222 start_codon:yes stop_codon:yes gene_type:complete